MNQARLHRLGSSWALTTAQAAQLVQRLPPLARTMSGLVMLSGTPA